MLGKSPIKRRQRPDMNIDVDWGVKHNFRDHRPSGSEEDFYIFFLFTAMAVILVMWPGPFIWIF